MSYIALVAVATDPSRSRIQRVRTSWVASGAGWVVGAFVISRILAYLAGMRFDDQWIPNAWQFIDPKLLQHDLIPSVAWAHTQPPLFNFFLGVVLKFSPLPTAITFQATFLALGLVLTLSILTLARTLGCRRTTAIVVTILITCGPPTLLYENYLFYTYVTTVLVTLAAVLLARWIRTRHVGWFAGFVLVVGTASLTQALLHPVWFAAVVALAWIARPPRTHRVLAVAPIAILLVVFVSITVKNDVVAGVPSLSSWAGMNLSRVTVEQLPTDVREDLVARDVLSPVSEVPSFSNYSDYEPLMPPCEPTRHVVVLDQSVKSTNYVNFNYECFGPVFRQAQTDALAALRAEPGSALRASAASWQLSFMPTEDYQYLAPNRPSIERYDDLYRRLVLLTVPLPPLVHLPTDLGGAYADPVPFSVTALLALLAVASECVRSIRRWRRSGADAAAAVALYIGLTTLFVLVVGNATEIGENNRFRTAVEPLCLVVLGAVIDRLLVRWSARRA